MLIHNDGADSGTLNESNIGQCATETGLLLPKDISTYREHLRIFSSLLCKGDVVMLDDNLL